MRSDGGDALPTGVYWVADYPEYPRSLDPGEEGSTLLSSLLPREHIIMCFSGGASAAVQQVSIISGFTVTG